MLPEFLIAQKLLLLALTINLTDLALKLRTNKNKLATSRLGTNKDMGRLRGTDGLILSKDFQLNFKKTLEGVCVIGPPGEGKTTSIFLPNLLSNHLPVCSIVIADPKGEQYELTSEYQRSINRTPILFEPLGDNAKYNPLDHCNNFTEIRDLAQSLIQNGDLSITQATGKSSGGADWLAMATPLLTAALLENKTISQAIKFLINSTPDQLIEKLGKSNNEDTREQLRIFLSSSGSPKTMSSILSTLLTNLQLFTDHKIINNTSKSDFAPTDLRKGPIALFIKYDEAKSNYLAPFLSIFYSQLIEKIMYCEGIPVLFFLEELQNVGKISNFPQIAATGRSKEVGFLVCLQNLVKLHDIYGKNNAITILNALKCKCILPSISDLEALEYISNLCGDKEVPTESTSGDKKTRSITTRKMFTADEVRRIEDNKILLICHNKLPVLHEQNTYYNQKKYTDNIIKI